ncbi:ChrR family anti-sigma-E factor [Alphaproteobacteria bacterium]|nr:ChrR family anti-sigma-E factor [Alphaproteobacteria bacterium]
MNKQNTSTLVESLLIDYANGTLPLALEILVETHISMNPSSAKSIRMLLQLGGALLENSEPISLSEGSFEKLMAEIDSGFDKDQEFYTNVSNDNNLLPFPLRNYAQDIGIPKNWKRIGIGLSEQAINFGDNFGSAKLYKIAPGCSVPSHSHEGNEVTLVLSGGFTDEYGTYGPGDISIQETGAVHKPVADEDGECIVLAVNEGPIVLTGPVGRLLNMLIK